MKKFVGYVVAVAILVPSLVYAQSIDINKATIDQLDELAGIGPAYAQAIIDARPFSSVDDLLRVKGIGEKTLQKIKDQGFACVDCYVEDKPSNSIEAPPQDPPQSENPAPQPENQPPSPISYSTGIIINEIMPAPDGPDETDEWIELYNPTNAAVNVYGWELRDTGGITIVYTFPKNTNILPGHYIIARRPETKIVLNDEGDGVELVWPNGMVAHSVAYEKTVSAQSYNNISSTWKWSTTPTPGSDNILTFPKPALPKPKKSANNNAVSTQTAAATLPIKESLPAAAVASVAPSYAPILFLITGTVLLVCGGGVLGYYFIHHIRSKNHERSQSL